MPFTLLDVTTELSLHDPSENIDVNFSRAYGVTGNLPLHSGDLDQKEGTSLKRIALAICTALALTVFTFTTGDTAAHAASAGTVVNQTSCFPISFGATMCQTIKGESNTTTTSSGIVTTEFNGTMTSTIFDSNGVFVASLTVAEHYHSVNQNGVLQETGDHTATTFSSPFGTCTYFTDFHIANGMVQYNNSSSTC